jgi:hypothetical protein
VQRSLFSKRNFAAEGDNEGVLIAGGMISEKERGKHLRREHETSQQEILRTSVENRFSTA